MLLKKLFLERCPASTFALRDMPEFIPQWRDGFEGGANNNMGYTYILKSKYFNKHYIGSTVDLCERLKYHNAGQGGKYTKKYLPWEILCYKKCSTINEARKLEILVKSYKGGNAFKKIILGEVPEWLKGAPC